MNRHNAMLREQRKKILLLEGALHRLELVEAKAAIQSSLQTNHMAGLLKPALKMDKLLPLAASLLPLVIGKGRVSVWMRRALAVAGTGAVVLRMWRDLHQPAADESPN
jgi:hypothetical protein